MTGKELAELLRGKAAEVELLRDIKGFAFVLVPDGSSEPPVINLIAMNQFAPAVAFVEHLSAAMRAMAEPHGAINTYGINQGFPR